MKNQIVNTMLVNGISFTQAFALHSNETMVNTKLLLEVETEVSETLRNALQGIELIKALHVRDLHSYMTEEEYEYYYHNINN